MTEWWDSKPNATAHRDSEDASVFLTQRLYCPFPKVHHVPEPTGAN